MDPMSSTSSGSSGTNAPTEPAAPLTLSPCATPAGQQVKLMHMCHTNCSILTVHQYRSYRVNILYNLYIRMHAYMSP